MGSFLTIRMNLIFRVSLTLFIGSRLLDNIMNTSIKSRRSIENNYKKQSQSSHQIRVIVTHQSSSFKKE